MKVLFIADDGPANAWILQAVERHSAIQAILRPDWNAERAERAAVTPPRPTAPISTATRVIRRLRSAYFAGRDRATATTLTQLLFPADQPRATFAPVLTIPSWEINSSVTAEVLRGYAPDLIVVSGAPVLAPSIFNLPSLGCVNLHFGISPTYRGMHTLVTPWIRGDYAHIGATLHVVNVGIDAGPVLFRVYPALAPHDTVTSAEAHTTRLAAATLSEFLTWVSARESTTPLHGKFFSERGELVRFHDRTIRADLRMRLRRWVGSRAPTQPARVERYYAE